MDIALLKQMLVVALPVIGRLLKSIPFVSNKIIPTVLVAASTAKNYWILSGLPVAIAPTPEPTEEILGGSPELLVAGLFSGLGMHALSLGWGLAEGWISNRVHKSFKYRNRYKLAVQKGLLTKAQQAQVEDGDHWIA